MINRTPELQSSPLRTYYMPHAPYSNKLPGVTTLEKAKPYNERHPIDLSRGLPALEGLDRLDCLGEGMGFIFPPSEDRPIGITGIDLLRLMMNPSYCYLVLALADAELTAGELAQQTSELDINNAHNRHDENGHFGYEQGKPTLREASVHQKIVDSTQVKLLARLGLLEISPKKERLTSIGQLQNLRTLRLNENIGGSVLMIALMAAILREIAPDMIDIFPEKSHSAGPKTRSALGLSTFSSAIHTLYWLTQAPDQSFNSDELYDISGGLVGDNRAVNVRAFMGNIFYYLVRNDLIINPDSPPLFNVNEQQLEEALAWKQSMPAHAGYRDAYVPRFLAALRQGEVLSRNTVLEVIGTLYPPDTDLKVMSSFLHYLVRHGLLERTPEGEYMVVKAERPAFQDIPLYDARQIRSATELLKRFGNEGASIQEIVQTLSEIHEVSLRRAYEMFNRLRSSGSLLPVIEPGKEAYNYHSRFQITERGMTFMQLLLQGLHDPSAFTGIDPHNITRVRNEELIPLTYLPTKYTHLLEIAYQAMADNRGLERHYLEKNEK